MLKLASGEHVALVQFYWEGWCETLTGHEYLLPTKTADRFLRFWNRSSMVDATGKFWMNQ